MAGAYVIGLGKSGIAAARLLKHQGWQVLLSDRNTSAALHQQQQDLGQEGITVKLGHAFEADLAGSPQPQLIVVSPGVPWDHPGLMQSRSLGIETIGEMELAWRSLQSSPWVGITGTNGKTTTTALIAAIFQTAGLNAPACGNIGYAACELALPSARTGSGTSHEVAPDWVIAELSSYQIESSPSIAPRIGVWTTFTPDHLSRHVTLERYYSIKAHLLQQSQQQVFNGDDPYLRQVGREQWSGACWTSTIGKLDLMRDANYGVYVEAEWVIAMGDRVLPVTHLKTPGNHNQQNLLMAVAAAKLAGIENEAIAQAALEFPGVPHRLELICTWQGIDFINDSKATNYDAAQVGLAAVKHPVVLIAGGEAKAGDDTAWLQTIQARAIGVLLIGNAASMFADRLQQMGYTNYEVVDTLEQAVPRSADLAKRHHAEVVLFSPACASFDQFQNFEQRGDRFRELCLEISDVQLSRTALTPTPLPKGERG